MKREQLCITIWYISALNGTARVNEDLICLIDAVQSIAESLEDAAASGVRLTGQNL
jgi:hypothetical protein